MKNLNDLTEEFISMLTDKLDKEELPMKYPEGDVRNFQRLVAIGHIVHTAVTEVIREQKYTNQEEE